MGIKEGKLQCGCAGCRGVHFHVDWSKAGPLQRSNSERGARHDGGSWYNAVNWCVLEPACIRKELHQESWKRSGFFFKKWGSLKSGLILSLGEPSLFPSGWKERGTQGEMEARVFKKEGSLGCPQCRSEVLWAAASWMSLRDIWVCMSRWSVLKGKTFNVGLYSSWLSCVLSNRSKNSNYWTIYTHLWFNSC